MTAPIVLPAIDGWQSAESPSVEFDDQGRPWCVCGTSLNAGSTTSGNHAVDVRPTRVRCCPMGCGS